MCYHTYPLVTYPSHLIQTGPNPKSISLKHPIPISLVVFLAPLEIPVSSLAAPFIEMGLSGSHPYEGEWPGFTGYLGVLLLPLL